MGRGELSVLILFTRTWALVKVIAFAGAGRETAMGTDCLPACTDSESCHRAGHRWRSLHRSPPSLAGIPPGVRHYPPIPVVAGYSRPAPAPRVAVPPPLMHLKWPGRWLAGPPPRCWTLVGWRLPPGASLGRLGLLRVRRPPPVPGGSAKPAEGGAAVFAPRK